MGLGQGLQTGLWLARNEGMDPYIIVIVVSIFLSMPSFPANQRPGNQCQGCKGSGIGGNGLESVLGVETVGLWVVSRMSEI